MNLVLILQLDVLYHVNPIQRMHAISKSDIPFRKVANQNPKISQISAISLRKSRKNPKKPSVINSGALAVGLRLPPALYILPTYLCFPQPHAKLFRNGHDVLQRLPVTLNSPPRRRRGATAMKWCQRELINDRK